MNRAAPASSAVHSSPASLDEGLDAGDDDRLEESFFGGEVTVDRPDTNAGPAGHFVDGDGQALRGEHLLSRLEHFGPVTPGVRPERPEEVVQGAHGSWLSWSCFIAVVVLTPRPPNNSD